jgi:hypothetical protein
MRVWSQKYWLHVIDGATQQSNASLRFSDPAFNTLLVSPMQGGLLSIQRFWRASATSPTVDSAEQTTGGVPWEQFFSYTNCSLLQTDLLTEQDGSALHLNLLEAPQDIPASFEIEGTALVSTGVEIDRHVGNQDSISVPADPWTDVDLDFIADLRSDAAAIIAASDRSLDRMNDLLVGRTTYFEEFLDEFKRRAYSHGYPMPMSADLVTATIGHGYLSLPMVCLKVGYWYILVDTINGTISGPYAIGGGFDATELLLNYPDHYDPQDVVTYVDSAGYWAIGPTWIGEDTFCARMPDSTQLGIGDLVPKQWACAGCMICAAAVAASCGGLCATDPVWYTPGEGFSSCMGKCVLMVLRMPFDVWDWLINNQPITPEGIATSACGGACVGCSGKLANWLKDLFKKHPPQMLRPPPGWRPQGWGGPGGSVCNAWE